MAFMASFLRVTLSQSCRWGRYTLQQILRSAFPWIVVLGILGVAVIGLFIQALAFVEGDTVFQSWCMSIWRLCMAIGVVAWVHYDTSFHAMADRGYWCAAFDVPYPIRIAGQWSVGIVVSDVLLWISVLLGVMGSAESTSEWLSWGGYRTIELVLMWAVTQWVYASMRFSLAGGAALLLYMVGRLAPTLRGIIHAHLVSQLHPTALLKTGVWILDVFLQIVPPFHALDQGMTLAIQVGAYALILGGYTVWRLTLWPVRRCVY